MARYSAQQHTGNPVLDVILTTKMRACADRGITLTCVADGKLLDGMDAMDVASLFGNVLDNAIEATSRVQDPERRIVKLALFRQGEFVAVREENTYATPLRRDRAGALRTTKADADTTASASNRSVTSPAPTAASSPSNPTASGSTCACSCRCPSPSGTEPPGRLDWQA